MPTILRVGKYRLFFFSNEGSEPPHVHIESGESYAKFWLQPVTLARSVGYDGRELTLLRELVESRKQQIEEKWNEHFE